MPLDAANDVIRVVGDECARRVSRGRAYLLPSGGVLGHR